MIFGSFAEYKARKDKMVSLVEGKLELTTSYPPERGEVAVRADIVPECSERDAVRVATAGRGFQR
jgi:hypothetical protein